MLVVWKHDRLGRNLAHLVNTVQDLFERELIRERTVAGLKAASGSDEPRTPPDAIQQ